MHLNTPSMTFDPYDQYALQIHIKHSQANESELLPLMSWGLHQPLVVPDILYNSSTACDATSQGDNITQCAQLFKYAIKFCFSFFKFLNVIITK